jgi:hypothetical protein
VHPYILRVSDDILGLPHDLFWPGDSNFERVSGSLLDDHPSEFPKSLFKYCDKSNGFHTTGMDPIWLSCDVPPARSSRSRRQKSRSGPSLYLGIFTADPAEIARRLPRPRTPFVPAPVPLIALNGKGDDGLDLPCGISCESPPTSFDFGMGGTDPDTLTRGMSIF